MPERPSEPDRLLFTLIVRRVRTGVAARDVPELSAAARVTNG
jgi:hypothetical protein